LFDIQFYYYIYVTIIEDIACLIQISTQIVEGYNWRVKIIREHTEVRTETVREDTFDEISRIPYVRRLQNRSSESCTCTLT